MRATWDELLRPGPPRATSPRRTGWGWAAAFGEELLTFLMTFAALIAAITSIERADWVDEMPDLAAVAAVSLVFGWLLARVPLPAWALQPPGILAGLAYVWFQVQRAMQLAPGEPDTWTHRASELWARNRDWLTAVRNGEFSTDPIPFVLMVVIATWALAYLAAWAVARWRNPWLALIPGAIALLTNISYLPGQPSAELIVFLFASILLFARLHMLRTVDRLAAAQAEPPPLLSLEVLNLATWLGLVLIIAAWIVPTANHWGPVAAVWAKALSPVTSRVERVGELFVGISSKRATGLHQFEGVLPLQGSVTLGQEPLMTVEAAGEGYLLGTVYDQYTSNGWKQGPTDDRPFMGPTVGVAATEGTSHTRAQGRVPTQAAVHLLETFARRRLFSFGEPLAASIPSRAVTGGAPEDLLALAPEDDLQGGREYTSVGSTSAASAERLAATGTDYPAWVRDRYLQLPPTLPGEVHTLARQVAGDERVPYRLAVRVEEYLRRSYAYSLDIGSRPPKQDSVQYFLFDRRQGYSDYFATAMAVMLRSLGVPSRVAVGFAITEGERDPVTKQFVVTDEQSWVWPQVYFPGSGWVDFNPTPSRAAIDRPGEDTEVLPLPDSGFEGGLLPDDLQDLDIPVVPGTSVPLETPQSAWSRFVSRFGSALLALAIAVLALVAVVRIAWDLPYRRMAPATRRWAKLQALATWAGIPLRTDRTPLEEAAQLGAAVRRPPLDLTPLARAYVAERYGRAVPATTESRERASRLDTIYMEARSRLMKRAFSRFFSIRG